MLMKILAVLLSVGVSTGGAYETYEVIDRAVNAEVVVVQPAVEDLSTVTEEQMENAKSTIKKCLTNVDLYNVKVDRNGDYQFEIEYYDPEQREAIIDLVGKKSVIEFLDADGNVVLDMSHISSAGYIDGIVDDNEYHVGVYFTSEGREAFKKATEDAVSRMATGENYIQITVDGEVFSAPYVSEVIDADNCIISGLESEEAKERVISIINSGQLPFAFEVVE